MQVTHQIYWFILWKWVTDWKSGNCVTFLFFFLHSSDGVYCMKASKHLKHMLWSWPLNYSLWIEHHHAVKRWNYIKFPLYTEQHRCTQVHVILNSCSTGFQSTSSSRIWKCTCLVSCVVFSCFSFLPNYPITIQKERYMYSGHPLVPVTGRDGNMNGAFSAEL